jgi:hypothetical protein
LTGPTTGAPGFAWVARNSGRRGNQRGTLMLRESDHGRSLPDSLCVVPGPGGARLFTDVAREREIMTLANWRWPRPADPPLVTHPRRRRTRYRDGTRPRSSPDNSAHRPSRASPGRGPPRRYLHRLYRPNRHRLYRPNRAHPGTQPPSRPVLAPAPAPPGRPAPGPDRPDYPLRPHRRS